MAKFNSLKKVFVPILLTTSGSLSSQSMVVRGASIHSEFRALPASDITTWTSDLLKLSTSLLPTRSDS